jgi:hypothetical protein
MDAEGAEEKGKEDAYELVFAGAFIFGIKPGALLVVHVDGVDGIDGVHMSFLSNEYMGVYAEWRTAVPFVIRLPESVFKAGFRLEWSQFTRIFVRRRVSTIAAWKATARCEDESDGEKAGGSYAGSS